MSTKLILGLMAAVILISLVGLEVLQQKNDEAIKLWNSDKPVESTVKPIFATPAPTVEPTPTPEPTPYITLSSEQETRIATICESEDNLHGLEGRTGVALSIRNRYLDGRFGDSLEDICVASQYHGLYDPEEPTEAAYEAVRAVFFEGCEDITQGGLYFCTPSTSPTAIKQGLRETARVGGHIFYTDLEE